MTPLSHTAGQDWTDWFAHYAYTLLACASVTVWVDNIIDHNAITASADIVLVVVYVLLAKKALEPRP